MYSINEARTVPVCEVNFPRLPVMQYLVAMGCHAKGMLQTITIKGCHQISAKIYMDFNVFRLLTFFFCSLSSFLSVSGSGGRQCSEKQTTDQTRNSPYSCAFSPAAAASSPHAGAPPPLPGPDGICGSSPPPHPRTCSAQRSLQSVGKR